ncbi:MAG TPA: hypothetical protein VIJ01_07455 [Candidatus Angelobacter sp.]
MEQTKSGNQAFLEGRFNSVVTILLAVVVTLVVCLTIAGQWKTYDWIKKLMALALVSNLAIVPLAIIVNLRKGRTVNLTCRPRCVLLAPAATLLFNR